MKLTLLCSVIGISLIAQSSTAPLKDDVESAIEPSAPNKGPQKVEQKADSAEVQATAEKDVPERYRPKFVNQVAIGGSKVDPELVAIEPPLTAPILPPKEMYLEEAVETDDQQEKTNKASKSSDSNDIVVVVDENGFPDGFHTFGSPDAKLRVKQLKMPHQEKGIQTSDSEGQVPGGSYWFQPGPEADTAQGWVTFMLEPNVKKHPKTLSNLPELIRPSAMMSPYEYPINPVDPVNPFNPFARIQTPSRSISP